MTQEMTGWLLDRLDRDMTRLIDTARESAGTPGGREVTRLAMNQVSGIKSQQKVIEIASKALDGGGDPRLGEVIAWLAYARMEAPGYLETWAPDEIDLISTLDDYDLGDDLDR